jgi:hypothetical protein
MVFCKGKFIYLTSYMIELKIELINYPDLQKIKRGFNSEVQSWYSCGFLQ